MIGANDAGRHDTDQHDTAYRFDWGLAGLGRIGDGCDVIVVVDVLRFSTAVCAAIEAGGSVLPFRWDDERAASFAGEQRAILAGRRSDGEPSLSPTDMLTLQPGTPVVLPSPNGATIAIEAAARGVPFVLSGCLRNATATARRARTLAHDGAIGVIAAGERHVEASGGGPVDEHPIRFAVEDLIGAGAVLHALDPAGSIGPPCCSPEARAARAAFLDARPDLHQMLITCGSGRELAGRTCVDDVTTAAEHDATRLAAQLIDGRFIGV